jgi:Domain of unknown function (DUF4261)
VAALTELAPAIAVVWTNGNALTEAKEFQSAARNLADRKLPVLAWMSVAVFDGPPAKTGARTTAMYTTGLAPFVGREIEFLPSTWPPTQIADRAIGTAQYLMERGPVIKDGETLGTSRCEKVRISLVAAGLCIGKPIFELSAPL